MVDLTSPNPFIMTHFELTAFLAAVAGVIITMIYDRVKRGSRR
jgi:branched-subunit amino acid ABC-type transport system permease component